MSRCAQMHPGNRRHTLRLGATLAGAWASAGWAAAPKLKLGWLGTTGPTAQAYSQAFVARLGELGYSLGRNLSIEFRTTPKNSAEQAKIAGDAAWRACDLYFAPGTQAGLMATVATTSTKPIVIVANDYDPVATGQATSLARPGGRITGVSQLQMELPAKRLELLRDLLPKAARVGVLADSATGGQLKVTRDAAARLGIELVVREFSGQPYDVASALQAMAAARCDAMTALSSGHFVQHRKSIVTLALQHKLPSLFNNATWVEAGGLLSYGPDFVVSYRRAAEMLARIAGGANVAEMPIEQPNAVEMVLNQKTARAIGLTLSQRMLLRADRIIE